MNDDSVTLDRTRTPEMNGTTFILKIEDVALTEGDQLPELHTNFNITISSRLFHLAELVYKIEQRWEKEQYE